MMTDKMIDEALVEILRTKKALEELRHARKIGEAQRYGEYGSWTLGPMAGAAKRATLDLTRKLAQLRAGK